MKTLRQQKVEKLGLFVGLIKYDKKEIYRGLKYAVYQAPLMRDGSVDIINFTIFGGGVGMSTSEFKTKQEAEKFYNDVVKLEIFALRRKYPDIVS